MKILKNLNLENGKIQNFPTVPWISFINILAIKMTEILFVCFYRFIENEL